MEFVILESPFASSVLFLPNGEEQKLLRDDNVNYARACLRDCLVTYGEAPYASHLLYTQLGILDDDIPEERNLGIKAGLEVGRAATRRIFYVDRGFSAGMRWGLKFAYQLQQPCTVRRLGGCWELGWDPDFTLGDLA